MFSRRPYARHNRGRIASNSGFSGNFAQLFASFVGAGNVLQVMQADLSLVEGTTLLDTGGTGPVLTFTGTRTGPPVPIWVKCTLGGALGVWTYAVYYDGVGTTPAMTGTSAASIPLMGAGAGLTLGIAAGAATLANIWKATAATAADQNGTGLDYTQALSARQPIITMGLSGYAAIAGTGGANNCMVSSLNLPAPVTTPTFIWWVGRTNNWVLNRYLFGDGAGANGHAIYANAATPEYRMFTGSNGPVNAGSAVGIWMRGEAYFTGSVNDQMKLGSTNSGTGTSSGNNASTGRTIFGLGAGTSPSVSELSVIVYCKVRPTQTQLDIASAAAVARYPTVLAA